MRLALPHAIIECVLFDLDDAPGMHAVWPGGSRATAPVPGVGSLTELVGTLLA